MRKYLILALLPLASLAQDLPDPKLTPGAINPELTAEKLCAKGFTTKDFRHTSEALKLQVYAEYGVKPREGYCSGPEGCEIDHLISLEIGGADVKENLWPQHYSEPLGAHEKDHLENTLHRLVCAGTITLDEAQTAIRTNWVDAFHRYVDKK